MNQDIDKEVAELFERQGYDCRWNKPLVTAVAAWARKREADLQNQIQRLWREINQYEAKPDEDGCCLRCGLIWQEPETTEKHICPPGFWRAEEAELAALRQQLAELKATVAEREKAKP